MGAFKWIGWWVLVGGIAAGMLFPAPGAFSKAIGPPEEGGVLPDVKLTLSDPAAHQQYLGVGAEGSFKIPQVRAELVILEIFSMYCPYCQKEAPVVNELYRLISGNPDLKDRVKILGIGAGNTSFEVATFQKQFSVPFPLVPDNDLSLHRTFGDVRTPYFIVIRKMQDGSHQVIYSKAGAFGNPQEFLNLLLSKGKRN